MYNIAVILAGGIGARLGGNTPKQLLPLQDGKSVLEHAVDAFEQSPHIDEICIVMHPDYIMHAEQMLLANACVDIFESEFLSAFHATGCILAGKNTARDSRFA